MGTGINAARPKWGPEEPSIHATFCAIPGAKPAAILERAWRAPATFELPRLQRWRRCASPAISFVGYRTPRGQYRCGGTFASLLRFRVELTSALGITGIRAMNRVERGALAMIVLKGRSKKTFRPILVLATL